MAQQVMYMYFPQKKAMYMYSFKENQCSTCIWEFLKIKTCIWEYPVKSMVDYQDLGDERYTHAQIEIRTDYRNLH